ncbi:MAG TPA: BON domain-containing protein [Ktedonobacterales bacterium]|nr:BON domain-containing protein [Ktedonobacterales bacterium]
MVTLTPRIRSDADIQQDVLEELSWDPHITVSDIGVSAKEGIVTLTGLVDNYLVRLAAQSAALRVRGVHAVANDIEVRLHTSAERTDGDLALAALYALKWDAAIQTDKLDVTVSHGYVTLKGEVEWPFQREAAERVVRRLAGVRGVTNWVTVAPHATPGDIKQKIERALVRNATTDANRIQVEVAGHTATLRGQVRSFAEKLAAERTALAAQGITTVNNEIKIVYEG